ncbi:MAG: hypothetical protein ACTSQJ_00250 [Promethearchaeota archaeon]
MTYYNIEQIIKSYFNQYNIVDRLQELERWRRNQADPNISDNITKINTIFNEINNNIYPKIQEASRKAVDASNIATIASDKALQASNLAVEAKNKAEQFYNEIQVAKSEALTASDKAVQAMNFVSDFSNRLITTGTQLQSDLDAIMEAEAKLRSVLAREMDGVKRQYYDFSDAVKSASDRVRDRANEIADEFGEAAKQIGEPLAKVIEHARKLPEIADGLTIDDIPRIAFLPYNLFQMARYLTWDHIFGGHDVLDETVEANDEIKVAFSLLGSALKRFGITLKIEANKLGDRLIHANEVINDAFKEFIDTFHTVFYNMSFHIRGETPPG